MIFNNYSKGNGIGFPDYSKVIKALTTNDITTGYTVKKDCWFFGFSKDSRFTDLTIDGVLLPLQTSGTSSVASIIFPIKKGQTIKQSTNYCSGTLYGVSR